MTAKPPAVGTISSTSNFVYIVHDNHGWVPARLISSTDKTATVIATFPSGKEATVTVNLSDYDQYSNSLPLQNVDPNGGHLLEVEDMIDLSFLHEAAILYNLKSRHGRGLPYTRTGDIVIAVNPYQWLHDLYTPATQAHYASSLIWSQSSSPSDVHPHVYETSSLAYRGLAYQGQNQSILVSGESGAGKTETVKILMSHLAAVQMGGVCRDNSVIKKVLDSNPLLEAFGNAKTARNDNSSRFGKFIQLQFDTEDPHTAVLRGKTIPPAILAGSKCVTYLLEKSRVVLHERATERGFHVFYQLLAGPEEYKLQLWENLAGKTPANFRYLGPTDTYIIEGKTDAVRFGLTVEALKTIGICGETLNCLMESMCIVLQLGNLIFDADPDNEENSIITSLGELEAFASLMGMEVRDIRNALTIRTVTARNEVYKVPLNAVAAKDCCDAFAKEIYARVFDWLVRKNNEATTAAGNPNRGGSDSERQLSTIGLLDIFGFESFEVNRFEQLCINYANEKLQEKFTQDIFRSIQAEYEYEGIELDEVKFEDNSAVLNLVEGRMGLISVLNEECVRPRGNDVSFVKKLNAANKGSGYLVQDKNFRDYKFGIEHYVGPVVYDATNFVKKNMDTLPGDLKDCARKCSNKLVREEIARIEILSPESSSGINSEKPLRKRKSSGSLVSETVSTKFKSQLQTLMQSISETRTRYIRCIKPNFDKAPMKMDNKATLSQLRCAGVVAALTISRVFPNRLKHDSALERFSCLLLPILHATMGRNSSSTTIRDRVERMLSVLLKDLETTRKDGSIQKAFVCGKTRVYFRSGSLEHVQSRRLKLMNSSARAMQTIVRGNITRVAFIKRRAIARETYARMCHSAIRLQSVSRSKILREKFGRLKASCLKIQCWSRFLLACIDFNSMRRSQCATKIQSQLRNAVLHALWRKLRNAAATIQAAARGAIQRPIYRKQRAEAIERATMEYKMKLQLLKQKLEEAEEHRNMYLRNARLYAWRSDKIKPMVRVRSINEKQIFSSTLTPTIMSSSKVEGNPSLKPKTSLIYTVGKDKSLSQTPSSTSSSSYPTQTSPATTPRSKSRSSPSTLNPSWFTDVEDEPPVKVNVRMQIAASTIRQEHQVGEPITAERKKITSIRDKMKVRVRNINEKQIASTALIPMSVARSKQGSKSSLPTSHIAHTDQCTAQMPSSSPVLCSKLSSFTSTSRTAMPMPSLTPASTLSSQNSSFDEAEHCCVNQSKQKKIAASFKQSTPMSMPSSKLSSLSQTPTSVSKRTQIAVAHSALTPISMATSKQNSKPSWKSDSALFDTADADQCAVQTTSPRSALCSKLLAKQNKQKQIAVSAKKMLQVGQAMTTEEHQRTSLCATDEIQITSSASTPISMPSSKLRGLSQTPTSIKNQTQIAAATKLGHQSEQAAMSVRERVRSMNDNKITSAATKTRKPSLKLDTTFCDKDVAAAEQKIVQLSNQVQIAEAVKKGCRIGQASTTDRQRRPLSRLITPLAAGFVCAIAIGGSPRNEESPSLRGGRVMQYQNEDVPILSPEREPLHVPMSYQSFFSDTTPTCGHSSGDIHQLSTCIMPLTFSNHPLFIHSRPSCEHSDDARQLSTFIEPLSFSNHSLLSDLRSTSGKLDCAYQQSTFINDFWKEMCLSYVPEYVADASTHNHTTMEHSILPLFMSTSESLKIQQPQQEHQEVLSNSSTAYRQSTFTDDFWKEMYLSYVPDYIADASMHHQTTIASNTLQFHVSTSESLATEQQLQEHQEVLSNKNATDAEKPEDVVVDSSSFASSFDDVSNTVTAAAANLVTFDEKEFLFNLPNSCSFASSPLYV